MTRSLEMTAPSETHIGVIERRFLCISEHGKLMKETKSKSCVGNCGLKIKLELKSTYDPRGCLMALRGWPYGPHDEANLHVYSIARPLHPPHFVETMMLLVELRDIV